uniref:Uncharacterized protein n=1 Tax=Vitis vinifera TaxID=29760 RepID=A5BPM1_VITVI|nr:hypothetical protein VITISV_019784 [Vitis vinifera]
MPLSQALQKLIDVGLLTTLAPRPLSQPIPPQFRIDLHCAYHHGLEHETDRCTALKHAIQDLIDQGMVHLGQPSVTTNPLPTHTTHAILSPVDDIHFIDFAEPDGHIHMLSWDESEPKPIVVDGIYENTQACISIWSLLTSSNIHRDALIQAMNKIMVETTTTPEGLIHMMTVGRVTCIVFSDDDLLPKGSDHTRYLHISVGCSNHRVPYVLLDNDSALNIWPLATTIALGHHEPSEFIVVVDHDAPFGLGFIPIESNYRYMTQLHKERTHLDGIIDGFSVVQEAELQCFAHKLQLSDGAPGIFASALVVPSSLDCISLLTFYFPDEVDEYGTFIEIGDMVDETVPHDEYIDEMLAMSMSQIYGNGLA